MPSIICYSGEEILLDEKDYEKAKDFEWKVTKRSHTSRRIIYTTSGRKYHETYSLTTLLLGEIRPYCLAFRNGNDLDYRRDNIYLTRKRSNETPQHRSDIFPTPHCPFGASAIESVRITTEESERVDCGTCLKRAEFDSFYSICLSHASRKDWQGWRRIKA